MFAYAVGALVIASILFVVTTPTINPYVEKAPSSQSSPIVQDTPRPRPEHDEYVEPRATSFELEGSAAESVRATNAYGVLTQAIGSFEDSGNLVSFVVHDLSNGRELTYDSTRIQYPASSIKAPYTTCVYQELIEPGDANMDEVYPLAQETIIDSSDDAYRALRDQYGSEVFEAWLKDADVGYDGYDSYGEMLHWNYSHMCSEQLIRMWIHMYDYLQTDTEPANQLADLLEHRAVSALRQAVGPRVRTWGKMGWFDYFGDYDSEPATVEGGIVFSSEGPYAVAVMTTAPAQINDLVPIFTAISRAHYDMI